MDFCSCSVTNRKEKRVKIDRGLLGLLILTQVYDPEMGAYLLLPLEIFQIQGPIIRSPRLVQTALRKPLTEFYFKRPIAFLTLLKSKTFNTMVR